MRKLGDKMKGGKKRESFTVLQPAHLLHLALLRDRRKQISSSAASRGSSRLYELNCSAATKGSDSRAECVEEVHHLITP